jgi:hypothetical protein
MTYLIWKVMQGLSEGKKLNLDKSHNLVDVLTLEYEEEELNEQMQQLFSKPIKEIIKLIKKLTLFVQVKESFDNAM